MPHPDHAEAPRKRRAQVADSAGKPQLDSPASSGMTLSGIPLKAVYAPEDLSDFDPQYSLGAPGEFPYTRGIFLTKYYGTIWSIRQYAVIGTANHAKARYHYLRAHSQTGLSVPFDLTTQMSFDTDHPRARDEVNKVGVAICSLEDMQALCE